jgi:hypothetical protein
MVVPVIVMAIVADADADIADMYGDSRTSIGSGRGDCHASACEAQRQQGGSDGSHISLHKKPFWERKARMTKDRSGPHNVKKMGRLCWFPQNTSGDVNMAQSIALSDRHCDALQLRGVAP